MKDNHEGPEHREGDHGAHEEPNNGSSVPFVVKTSTLSWQEDQVTARVIGAAIAVHTELGPGFLESIYKRAMVLEMRGRKLAFEQEVPVRVSYRGEEIPGQRIDLIVEGLVVVELKSVVHLDRVHTAQVISYLKTTHLRAGLLLNFRVPVMRLGIRRVVL